MLSYMCARRREREILVEKLRLRDVPYLPGISNREDTLMVISLVEACAVRITIKSSGRDTAILPACLTWRLPPSNRESKEPKYFTKKELDHQDRKRKSLVGLILAGAFSLGPEGT
jgi:hypothetical protein